MASREEALAFARAAQPQVQRATVPQGSSIEDRLIRAEVMLRAQGQMIEALLLLLKTVDRNELPIDETEWHIALGTVREHPISSDETDEEISNLVSAHIARRRDAGAAGLRKRRA